MEDVFLMHFSYPLPYLKHKSSSSGWQIDSSTLACGSSLSGHHGNRALKLWVAGRRHIPYLWAHISTVCKSKSKITKAWETEIFNFMKKMTNYWLDQFILFPLVKEFGVLKIIFIIV